MTRRSGALAAVLDLQRDGAAVGKGSGVDPFGAVLGDQSGHAFDQAR